MPFSRLIIRRTFWLWICAALVAAFPPGACLAHSLTDGVKLQNIGRAYVIYASDHHDRFPEVSDVWEYAQILAEGADLNDARIWQSAIDPATQSQSKKLTPILVRSKDGKTSATAEFRASKPSFAVVVSKVTLNSSSTTPIAWTRGLQPDGTWAPHSPYGQEGGWIFFIGGNIAFYKDLRANGGELIDRQGSRTANILEALPRGARISEYVPTAVEQKAWAESKREYPTRCCIRNIGLSVGVGVGLFSVIWTPFLVLSWVRYRKGTGHVLESFILPAILTGLSLLIFPF